MELATQGCLLSLHDGQATVPTRCSCPITSVGVGPDCGKQQSSRRRSRLICRPRNGFFVELRQAI